MPVCARACMYVFVGLWGSVARWEGPGAVAPALVLKCSVHRWVTALHALPCMRHPACVVTLMQQSPRKLPGAPLGRGTPPLQPYLQHPALF